MSEQVSTAELLARLNAVGVEVKREDLPLIYTGRWEFRWQDKHTTFDCSNVEARNAATVAALEVLRSVMRRPYVEGQDRRGCAIAMKAWDDLADSDDDLATAAVEAAIRVKKA